MYGTCSCTNRRCNNLGSQDAVARKTTRREHGKPVFEIVTRFNDGSAVLMSPCRFNWKFQLLPRRIGDRDPHRFVFVFSGPSEISNSLSRASSNLSYEETRYRQIPADQANEGPCVNHPFVTLWLWRLAVNYVFL